MSNLEADVDEELLYELMLQAAPVVRVQMHKGSGTMAKTAIVEYGSASHAAYAQTLLNRTRLYGRPIKIIRQASTAEKITSNAVLFVNGIDKRVASEESLKLPFSAFGNVLGTRIDDAGHGFVTMDTFEAADKALAALDGQYLLNKPVHVTYAFKTGTTEPHGDIAERRLEELARKRSQQA